MQIFFNTGIKGKNGLLILFPFEEKDIRGNINLLPKTLFDVLIKLVGIEENQCLIIIEFKLIIDKILGSNKKAISISIESKDGMNEGQINIFNNNKTIITQDMSLEESWFRITTQIYKFAGKLGVGSETSLIS